MFSNSIGAIFRLFVQCYYIYCICYTVYRGFILKFVDSRHFRSRGTRQTRPFWITWPRCSGRRPAALPSSSSSVLPLKEKKSIVTNPTLKTYSYTNVDLCVVTVNLIFRFLTSANKVQNMEFNKSILRKKARKRNFLYFILYLWW